ncbi:MAG: hypothetical protein PV340_04425 [Wolbachia sp.]|nr:hypothetical protein [Wolbachia sp.]MDD9336068.1 hypothetical protein [Wolbachia sp.]
MGEIVAAMILPQECNIRVSNFGIIERNDEKLWVKIDYDYSQFVKDFC